MIPTELKIIGINETGGKSNKGRKDLVNVFAGFIIDPEITMIVEICGILKIHQFPEHGIVFHIVTIDQCVSIAEIRSVVGIHKDTARVAS